MVGAADRRVALVSIHPRHANAILDGTKQFEFRRAAYPAESRYVVIYATAPVQRVIGWFEIDMIERGSPSTLWRRFGPLGAIDRETFRRYYRACPVGAAIRVRGPVRLEDPMPLAALESSLKPPQSFQYLSASAAAAVGIPG